MSDADIDRNSLLNLTSTYFGFRMESLDEYSFQLLSPFELKPNVSCNGLEVIISDQITAADNGQPSLYTTAELKVIVTDINNHIPQIAIDRDILVVKERAAIGTLVANILVTDDDPCAPNNRARVELESSEFSSFFTIQNNSELIVADDQLGSESDSLVDETIELTIVASDRGTPSLSSSLTVNVRIQDSNDEVPIFVNFTAMDGFPENVETRTEIGSFGQFDIDRNSNLSQSINCSCFKKTVQLSSCQLVDLDKTTFPRFSIQVVDTVDYEEVDQISCTMNIADENGISRQVASERSTFEG